MKNYHLASPFSPALFSTSSVDNNVEKLMKPVRDTDYKYILYRSTIFCTIPQTNLK